MPIDGLTVDTRASVADDAGVVLDAAVVGVTNELRIDDALLDTLRTAGDMR